MNHYELLVILPGKLSETELPANEQMFRELLRTEGVTFTREESLGKKKLSYPIRGEQFGYYYSIECDAEPEKVKTLADRMRLSPDILRHALYAKPVKSKETQDRETKLRERIAERRTTKAAVKAAEAVRAAPVVATTPAEAASIDLTALDKKLEELMQAPEKV